MTKYGVSHRSAQPIIIERKAPSFAKAIWEILGFQAGKGAPFI
jgi:hypothetical protein